MGIQWFLVPPFLLLPILEEIREIHSTPHPRLLCPGQPGTFSSPASEHKGDSRMALLGFTWAFLMWIPGWQYRQSFLWDPSAALVISDPQSYYFIGDLLGGDGSKPGMEIKTCQGLSYTLFPDLLRRFSTKENKFAWLHDIFSTLTWLDKTNVKQNNDFELPSDLRIESLNCEI